MNTKPKDMEDKILEFWAAKGIYEKAKANRSKAKKWYFLDGPPYATGSIHVGTAMNKVIKDFWLRYYRMLGYDAWSQPGYDTHGVPIENKVEKLLGFRAKGDIEEYGVEKFIAECKRFATKYIGVMGDQFKNLGVWMDWDMPYMTLSNEYIEGAWYTFKKAFEQGLLYRGTYSVHVCPRCETAVAYNEIEYKEVDDNSIFVKFKVSGKGKSEYLVIWTTTPWTIPSNTGVMVNPNEDYVRVDVGSGEVLIVGKPLLERLMEKFKVGKYKVLETFKGSKLEGMRYDHPLEDMFEFLQGLKNAHRVVLSDRFVSMNEGTGLVHTAPGHGQEDYIIGKEKGLPVVNPLNMDGTFGEGSGKYEGVFAKDADKMLLDELKRRGTILATEMLRHDYPMCWRDDSPLLMMAVPQWFFRVTKIRDQLLAANEEVKWVPGWAGQRFKNWLESLGDWPISRQRYWGIPLPIWVCEKCDAVKVIGSREELPRVPKDFHKPHIDEVTMKCGKCGGIMRRVPDVLDVWFDSGVAAWASLGYPKDKKLFERLWPVDFVLEGPDQIRGWWNSCMITSMMTFGRRAFDAVLFHGFVLDAHGDKMSKSKGNILTTEEAIDKYGRDVLRFYYLSRPVWDDMHFSVEDLNELAKSFIVVRNTFNFVKTYVKKAPKAMPKTMKREDMWILSRLNSVVAVSTEHCKSFSSNKAGNEILDFILNDFSRWYIKLIRDRVWPEYSGADKQAAFYTLFTVTETIAKLLAPSCPFLTESVYHEVIKSLKGAKATKQSIHMEDWPRADKKMTDEKLEKEMTVVKQIVEASHAARHDAGIKLRWPVASVVVVSDRKEVVAAVKELQSVLQSMCNAKKIVAATKAPKGKFVKNAALVGDVFVETKMTDSLQNEALFRELVRAVQSMRKKAGLRVSDRILLTIESDKKTAAFLKKKTKDFMKEVGADKTAVGKAAVGKHKSELKFKSAEIKIAFDRK
jgi:isoleucyl-tRNA synthetase